MERLITLFPLPRWQGNTQKKCTAIGYNGRGIPVDVEPKTKLTGVEVVLTKLHAGAKFGNYSYGASGGLHGVGSSVVNALSSRLDVEVDRDSLSNNATLASVPDFMSENTIPSDFTIEEYAGIVERCSMNLFPEIPTANGFCMYIKREAINNIGLFDEKTFGKGYGEEND